MLSNCGFSGGTLKTTYEELCDRVLGGELKERDSQYPQGSGLGEFFSTERQVFVRTADPRVFFSACERSEPRRTNKRNLVMPHVLFCIQHTLVSAEDSLSTARQEPSLSTKLRRIMPW